MKFEAWLTRGMFGEKAEKIAEAETQGAPEVKEAQDEIASLAKAAEGRLDEIRGLVSQREYATVAGDLDELIRTYAGMPIVADAEKIRDDLMADPEAKLALRTQTAEKLFADTRKDLEAKKYGVALERLESLVDEYSDLPLGETMKAELTKLKSDRSIVEAVRDEAARTQCNAWLSLARTWAKNGSNKRAMDKAKGYYQRVIENFPDTSFSKIAEEEMSELTDV